MQERKSSSICKNLCYSGLPIDHLFNYLGKIGVKVHFQNYTAENLNSNGFKTKKSYSGCLKITITSGFPLTGSVPFCPIAKI